MISPACLFCSRAPASVPLPPRVRLDIAGCAESAESLFDHHLDPLRSRKQRGVGPRRGRRGRRGRRKARARQRHQLTHERIINWKGRQDSHYVSELVTSEAVAHSRRPRALHSILNFHNGFARTRRMLSDGPYEIRFFGENPHMTVLHTHITKMFFKR